MQGQTVYVLSVCLDYAIRWGVVQARWRIKIAVFKILNAVVLLERSEEATTVVIVCNATTVVNVTSNEHEGLPGNLVLLVEKDF